MTVSELRKLLADKPDDMPVVVKEKDSQFWWKPIVLRIAKMGYLHPTGAYSVNRGLNSPLNDTEVLVIE